MSDLNKKGFTLVELLITIMLIAVVVGIAVFSITGIVARIRKGVLATEGVQAAKAAFYDAKTSNVFWSGTTVCYSLEWLCNNNYYDKGCNGGNAGDRYSGSVMIRPVNNELPTWLIDNLEENECYWTLSSSIAINTQTNQGAYAVCNVNGAASIESLLVKNEKEYKIGVRPVITISKN